MIIKFIIACISPAESHTYQLRAYLYQAKDMYGSDRSGLSDPYAIISLSHYSSRSRVVKADVCPTWDQTIIISNIKIFGATKLVEECPPPVVLEFFDEDKVVGLIIDWQVNYNTGLQQGQIVLEYGLITTLTQY